MIFSVGVAQSDADAFFIYQGDFSPNEYLIFLKLSYAFLLYLLSNFL